MPTPTLWNSVTLTRSPVNGLNMAAYLNGGVAVRVARSAALRSEFMRWGCLRM